MVLELGKFDLKKVQRIFTGHNYFKENQLLYILKSIAEALAALRKMRICHLDIKPGNIIFTENN